MPHPSSAGPLSPVTDPVTLDILQANVQLLAEKERLEGERQRLEGERQRLEGERQRLEGERQRLLDAEHERTEFIARVSHDLRTPLSSIIGFSDLILTGEGAKLSRRYLDYIEAIHRNGHQLLALINDMLDLTTLEARRMTIRRQEVPLSELLADLRAATEPVLLQAGLQTTWPEASTLARSTANIDRRRILQVLVNLVDNARKFTPRGGQVTVSLTVDAQEALFSVTDSGPGIPESDRTGIFRPYAQRGAVPSHEGVGLGLAIVKAIVDLHGGAITLTDGPRSHRPGDGRGCSFHVRIPQHAAEFLPTAEMP